MLLAMLGTAAAVPVAAQESNLTPLVGFGTTTVEDAPRNPRGDLLLANDGNFYVASFAGGRNGGGAVARITPDGTLTVLGSLTGNDGLGAQSYSRLTQASDGHLYGTTYLGGRDGRGTVFRATLAGELTTLYAFESGKGRPMLPYTGVVQAPDGALYGTTMRGGAQDAGTVFRLTLSGELTVLHEFAGRDGQNPEGSLIVGSDGDLYGTTLIGGDDNRGTIYRISTAGNFTSLYSFPNLGKFDANGLAVNDIGANPRSALLLASDGNYYGTAYQGGARGYGTIYRMTPAGEVSVVHSFGGPSGGGGFPLAGLTEGTPGVFYGTTERGGHVNIGSVYRLADGQVTVLHSFSASASDGQYPYATVQLHNGFLYGISYNDGIFGAGAMFRLLLADNGPLPVQFSLSPTTIEQGGSLTLNWSSPTAASCTTGGAWNSTVGTSGTETVTPPIAGFYTYILTCTDGAGAVHTAYARASVNAPEREVVDGGAGGGALSPWLLLLAATLLSTRLKGNGRRPEHVR